MLELNATKARILGALIEKEYCTPEYYPLTLNALKNACNQKSSREPVMQLEEGELLHTLRELEVEELVTIDTFGKAEKYHERLRRVLNLTPEQAALIAVLLLRGAQTLNQLFVRTQRYCDFTDEKAVQGTLLDLSKREDELVVILPKAQGAREVRYMHQLCGGIDMTQLKQEKTLSPTEERLAKLEARLLDLEERIEELEGKYEN